MSKYILHISEGSSEEENYDKQCDSELSRKNKLGRFIDLVKCPPDWGAELIKEGHSVE